MHDTKNLFRQFQVVCLASMRLIRGHLNTEVNKIQCRFRIFLDRIFPYVEITLNLQDHSLQCLNQNSVFLVPST